MANEYLQRTPTSTGNRKVFTWSGWVKKAENSGGFGRFFESGAIGDRTYFTYTDTDAIRLNEQVSSSNRDNLVSNYLLRDSSSLCHVMIAVNSTSSQEHQRVKIYINGSLINNYGFSTDDPPGLNAIFQHNESGETQYIGNSANQAADFQGIMSDVFMVDGLALTPDVFGFYKEGKGYQSSGTNRATDFRPGQWVPKKPSVIKNSINKSGGFGVNGYYLPMNDSSNFGADFHCDPNTIITLQDETAAQPKNGAPTTTDSYVSQLRSDPYAANLVLAVPGITGAPGVAHTDFSANIKGSGTNKVVTANGNAGVAVTASYYGSAMQFDGTGDYFSVPNSSDLRFTSEDFTIEAWINTNSLSDNQFIFSQWNTDDNRRSYVLWLEAGALNFNGSSSGSNSSNGSIDNSISLGANQWHHAAVTREGTLTRLFLNGVCIGINTTTQDFYNNTDDTPRIGGEGGTGTREFDGYIQDLRVYKGVAKYKGGFDVSKPFAPVGIATYREVPDCTANNFATLNPLNKYGATSSTATLTNGNLTQTTTDGNRGHRSSTIGITTGKWYAEVQVQNSQTLRIGVIADKSPMQETDNVGVSRSEFSYLTTGAYGFNGALPAYGDTYTNNDVIGIALNRTDGTITFFKNGVSQGIATDILNNGDYDGQHFHFISADSSLSESGVFSWNFGQNPTFSGNVSVSSTQRNADVNGKGQFRYAPPADHLALCEDNLPAPEIADPGDYFKTVLYRGDGNEGHSITGVGFKPDLVWIKCRSNADDNTLSDTVRGPGLALYSNKTDSEHASNIRIQSFNDDGFTTGSSGDTNTSDRRFCAWCWKAGAGTTSSNTDGSINSVVSVNQDAGFSIATYTTPGTATNFGHGLGKKPAFALFKARTDSGNWAVYHQSLGTNTIRLSTDGAIDTSVDAFNDTEPTDTLMYLGTWAGTNNANINWISYLWAEIEGYSKFASYIGNGNADGPFVYCGFKPAWVMVKNIDDTGGRDWGIQDSSREPSNPCDKLLKANATGAENFGLADSTFQIDMLSNGFKVRNNTGIWNGNGDTIIFMAFAESPFKTANAK